MLLSYSVHLLPHCVCVCINVHRRDLIFLYWLQGSSTKAISSTASKPSDDDDLAKGKVRYHYQRTVYQHQCVPLFLCSVCKFHWKYSNTNVYEKDCQQDFYCQQGEAESKDDVPSVTFPIFHFCCVLFFCFPSYRALLAGAEAAGGDTPPYHDLRPSELY